MTEERITVKIGAKEFDLLLPENRRLKVYMIEKYILLMFAAPNGLEYEVWRNSWRANAADWFPDACDNAAEWHREQLNLPRRPDDFKEHYNACMLRREQQKLWRAAKRAHEALGKSEGTGASDER